MNEEKERMLNLAQLLSGASSQTIAILRETTLANIKALRRQRSSASIQSPLVSSMTNMYRKYPLSINREKAITYEVPSEYLSKISDKHTHDRILAKKEALSWWMEKATECTESNFDTIMLIYSGQYNKVKELMGMDWRKASIQWGPTITSRKQIVTRKACIKIPSTQIVRTCLYTLKASSLKPALLETDLAKIEEIRNSNLNAKMSFFTQYNILSACLRDEKRYLPYNTSIPEGAEKHAYVLLGQNYTIRGYHVPKEIKSVNTCQQWVNAIYKSVYFNIEAINTNALQLIRINGLRISDIVSNCNKTEISTSVISALLGKPTNLPYIVFGVKIYPEDHCPRFEQTAIGVFVNREPHGITFEYDEGRGYATVSDIGIQSIIVNECSPDTWGHVVAAICHYCKLGVNTVKDIKHVEKTRQSLFRERKRNPWKLFHAEPFQLRQGMEKYGISVRPTEILDSNPITWKMSMRGKSLRSPKGMIWDMPRPSLSFTLSPDIVVPQGILEDAYDPIRALRRRINFFLRDIKSIMIRVRNKNFKYCNELYGELIQHAGSVSSRCRLACEAICGQIETLKRSKCDNIRVYQQQYIQLAINYIFTHTDPDSVSRLITSINFCDNTIDLSFNEGLIQWDNQGIRVGGVLLDNSESPIQSAYMSTFLPGFQLKRYRPEDELGNSKRIKHIDSVQSFNEGDSMIIQLDKTYVATKNSNFQYSMLKTLKRSYTSILIDEEEPLESLLKKAKQDDIRSADESEGDELETGEPMEEWSSDSD